MEKKYTVVATSDEQHTLWDAARKAGVPVDQKFLGQAPGGYMTTTAGPCTRDIADGLYRAVETLWPRGAATVCHIHEEE